jgi:hypothetical protein
MTEEQAEKTETVSHSKHDLSPQEKANLTYQRELAKLMPGSAPFRALKASMRSVNVFKQPAAYWPTGRDLTEGGRRSRGRG